METNRCASIGSDLRLLDRWIERALVNVRNVESVTHASSPAYKRLVDTEGFLQRGLDLVRSYTETFAID